VLFAFHRLKVVYKPFRSGVTACAVLVSSLVITQSAFSTSVSASTDVTNVTGTAGNAQVSLSWTGPTSNSFPFSFNGVNYDSVFVGSNTYLTFGGGSGNFSGLSASNPNLPGVHLCTADNSYQRVQFLTNNSVSPNQLRIRYEGTASTGGSPGSPNIVYEAVFYRNQSYFDVLIGVNARCPGTRVVTNGSTALASPNFLANTNWRINGATVTQNGNTATWLGSSSGTVAPNTLGYSSMFNSSADDAFLQVPVAPTGYAVRHSTNGGSTWTNATTNSNTSNTSFNVTGLTNGIGYIFQVAPYYSSTGVTGSWSSSSPTYTPQGTPAAPTSLLRTAGVSQASLSWVAPTNTGGSAITDYRVEFSSNNGASWTTFSDGVGTGTTATVTGLVNGTSYVFRVAAVNALGTGAFSANSVAVTPIDFPGAPTSVTASAGNGQATLSWSVPASNGGSAITGYAVEISSNSGSTWSTAISNTGNTLLSYTATGLLANTAYMFRVAARNAAGMGSYSLASNEVTVFGVPGVPTAPTATAGLNQAVLAWSAPSANGSAINGYAIQYSSNNGVSWTSATTNTGSTQTTFTVTGLTANTSYVFRVAARNAAGAGSFSSNSSSVTVYNVPGVPTSVVATPSTTQVSLSWIAPAANGSAITDYTIQWSSNNGVSWSTFADGVSTATSAIVTGLTNGVSYQFRIAATNIGGTSSFSTASTAVIPRSAPGAVTGVAGSPGNTQVTLAWTAPTSTGGSAITGYAIEYSSNGGTSWITASANTGSTVTSFTATGLTNGVGYIFRIAARNIVGNGTYSATSATVTPFTIPGAPTSLTGTAGNSQVSLSWLAPSSDGGSPVNDYIIEYSTNSGTTWITVADGVSSATSTIVGGLTNGTGYIFRVTARNSAGNGLPSSTTSAIVARTVPSAVLSVVTTTGNSQVGLSWTAPTSTGGSAVTDYVIEFSSDSGSTWSTFGDGFNSLRTATVTGLTNGTAYVFRVSAVNVAGTGASSLMTSSVIPFTTPGQPTLVAGVFGDTQVSLTWSAPSGNGGSGITNYNVQYSTNSGTSWILFSRPVSVNLSTTVTGLVNGVSYIFRVAAVNAAGVGSYSAASTAVTPMRVATAPSVTALTAGDEQVTVTWSPPSSNGGSALTSYAVQYSSNNGSTWSVVELTGSTSTSYEVVGLTNGTAYVFRVGAVNAVGTGAFSTASSATTPRTTPGIPTSVVTTTGNTQVSLVWTAPTDTGGSAITDYAVQFSSNAGTTWSTFADGINPQRAATVTGLLNGTEYVFRIAATNVAGTGAFSSPSGGTTPRTAPSAPTINSIATDNSQLSVNFTAGDAGGTVIDTYQYSTDGGVTWRARSLGTTASPIVITTLSNDGTSSLTNGTTYSVRIRAVNAAGPGSASATTTATPLTLPSVPLSLSVTPASTSIVVSWVAPASNGGANITDYMVQYSSDSGGSWTTFIDGTSSLTSATVTSLVNGTAYIFRVAAVNSVGTGSYSLASSSATPRSAPLAPTGLTAAPGNGSATVSWTAPADGGAVLTDYVVQFSSDSGASWTTFTDGLSVDTTSEISGLTNGLGYLVRVAAVNVAGTGSWALTTSALTPRTVPSAPVLGMVTRLDSSLSIAFTSGFNGGSAITSYQSSIDGGSSWQNVSGLTSPLVLTELINGTTYSVSLRAVNIAGTGLAAVSVQGTPRTAPNAPTIESITAANSSLSVAFGISNTGGSALHNIEYSVTGGVSWLSAGTTTSPLVISGLANGTTYSVRLRAINAAGTSPQSLLVSSTPFTSPGAPAITSLVAGIGSVSVEFTPGFDGGSVISNYAYSTDNGATWVTRSPESTLSPMTISGLGNGVRYNVRVRAINARGNGAMSEPASVLTKGVPGAPSIIAVSQLDQKLSLHLASGTNGGEPITNYAYSLDNGVSWTPRTPASVDPTLLITGLVNGTDYNVRVRAINAVGSGDPSTTLVTRPHTTPDAPLLNSQTPGNQQLTVTFTAPNDGGAPITSYEYSTDRGLTWTLRGDGGGTSTTLVIPTISSDGFTALSNGTTYDVQIRAVNSVGPGDESADIAGTPQTVPSAPSVTRIDESNRQLQVFFVPRSNGGAQITEYQYTTDGGTTWRTASRMTSPITIVTLSTNGSTPLSNGTAYGVALRAVNVSGPGESSSLNAATPHTAPGAVSVSGVVTGDGAISVAFNEGGNGGSEIVSYEYSTDGGATWRTRTSGFTMVSSPIVITTLSSDGLTPLQNGISYDVLIRAVNNAGAGEESTTLSAIPSSVPHSPTINSVTGTDGTLTITYTPGAANGRAITSHEYSIDGGSNWTSTTSLSSPLVVTGLVNGTEYLVSLRHINSNGTSADSVAVIGKPRTRPMAPVISSATSADQSASIVFTAPASDGGDPITTYEFSTDNGSTWSARAFGTTETFINISTLSSNGTTNLVNGTQYSVRIRAVNGAGGGVMSDAVAVTPFTRPSGVVITSVTPSDSSADVAFTLSSDGGASLTSIEFTVDGGVTWNATNSTSNPVRVTGLRNGVVESIALRAVNAAGAGPTSNTMTTTPSGTPGGVVISSLTAGDGQLEIEFIAGSDSGSVITGYEYSIDDGATWVTSDWAGTGTTIAVNGLVNGRVYTTRLRAINANGTGVMSDAVLSKPFTVPSAPTAEARPGTNEIQLTFTPPSDDGGETITGYSYSLDSGTTWVDVGGIVNGRFVISNLVDATSYSVKLRAVSAAGNGHAVRAQTITPPSPVVPRSPAVSAPVDVPRQIIAQPITNVPAPSKKPASSKNKNSQSNSEKSPSNVKPPISREAAKTPALPASVTFGSSNGVEVIPQLTPSGNSAMQVRVGDSVATVTAVDTNKAALPRDSNGHIAFTQGGFVSITLEGFAPNTDVRVTIFSEPTLLGVFRTDDQGKVTINTQLPAVLGAGNHTLEVVGDAVDATVVSMALGVRVVDEPADEIEDNTPEVDGGGTQDSQDPDNGAPIAPLGAGLLLLLALAGFWAVRRRRHS
jgi:large repetitive protein